MSINEIIRAWKADDQDENAPANPAGQELFDEELEEVVGGLSCIYWQGTCNNATCDDTCNPAGSPTCTDYSTSGW